MDNGQCGPQSIDNRDMILCILMCNTNVKACADVNTYICECVHAYTHIHIHMHTSIATIWSRQHHNSTSKDAYNWMDRVHWIIVYAVGLGMIYITNVTMHRYAIIDMSQTFSNVSNIAYAIYHRILQHIAV